MATNFPGSLDSFTNPTSGSTLDSPSHAAQHANINDAVEAVQAKLGTGAGTIGDYSTFTPVWTADTTNPVIGNGIMNGRAVQINDLVIAQYEIRMGSTTTFGTGAWRFDYPVAYDPTGFFAFADIGFGRAYDSNVATVYNIHGVVNNSNTTHFKLSGDSTSGQVGATTPFTWASGDELLFTIVYKAA